MTILECLVKNGVFIKPEISNFNLQLTRDYYIQTQNDIQKAMIEFAKFHVEQAKKEIEKNVRILKRYDFGYGSVQDSSLKVDESSIQNSYPIENIK